MNKTKTIVNEPLFQTTENFLTSDECHTLIEIAKLNLQESKIINGTTGLVEISNYRTSESYHIPLDHILTHQIHAKISIALGIDPEQFEKIEIIRYKVGDMFDTHVDYFTSITEKKQFLNGGQRVGTVILYLNDVTAGGETFFPQLRIVEKSKNGKMVYFKYDYDGKVNIKTSHKGMPVDSGEKWIATVWIRQSFRTEIFENYKIEDSNIVNDTEFELDCITSTDIKKLSVKLPANYNPENVIIVDVTPNLKSALLLYLLLVLNNHQNIPYFILPVITDNYLSEDINLMSNMVDSVKKSIPSEYMLATEIYTLHESKIKNLIEFANNKSQDRFYKFSQIFVGDTQNAMDLANIPLLKDSALLIHPFLGLEETHLLYAIKELNIMNMLNNTKY